MLLLVFPLVFSFFLHNEDKVIRNQNINWLVAKSKTVKWASSHSAEICQLTVSAYNSGTPKNFGFLHEGSTEPQKDMKRF